MNDSWNFYGSLRLLNGSRQPEMMSCCCSCFHGVLEELKHTWHTVALLGTLHSSIFGCCWSNPRSIWKTRSWCYELQMGSGEEKLQVFWRMASLTLCWRSLALACFLGLAELTMGMLYVSFVSKIFITRGCCPHSCGLLILALFQLAFNFLFEGSSVPTVCDGLDGIWDGFLLFMVQVCSSSDIRDSPSIVMINDNHSNKLVGSSWAPHNLERKRMNKIFRLVLSPGIHQAFQNLLVKFGMAWNGCEP